MTKFILTVAAAGLLSLAACASKSDNQASAESSLDPKEVVKSINNGAERSGTVITCRNDNAYRPGMKVKRFTVLDFNATWCGPCRQLSPVFKAAAARYTDVDFVSIDVDNLPATAEAFGVQAVPTVIFLSPDGSSRRFVGTNELLPESTFFNLIENATK